jgi:hypothetical protein
MNKLKGIIKKVRDFFGKIFHKGKPGISGVLTKLKLDKLGKKGVFLVVVALVLGLLFYFRGLFISVVVNGQPISRFAVIQKLEKSGGKETLDNMITEALIYQEAKKLNTTATDMEITAEVNKLRTQIKESGQDLNTLLAFQKMTLKDLEEQIKLQKTVEKILADKVAVTEAEITQYMTDNKASLPTNMTPEETKAAVVQQLKSQKLGVEFQKWIEKVKATSNINYLVNY